MDLPATALHLHLYNTSQKKSHLQRYSNKRKKQNNKWVQTIHIWGTQIMKAFLKLVFQTVILIFLSSLHWLK